MSYKTKIAAILRNIGAEKLMENPSFRKAVGAPLYKRHADRLYNEKEETSPSEVPDLKRMDNHSTESSSDNSSRSLDNVEHKPVNKVEKVKKKEDPYFLPQPPVDSVSGPLLSVVVPCYNVKPYLHNCISTITRQSYKNLQIILVDDGSTDGTSQICDELAKRDKRITVIHQENAGLSAARNSGVDSAEGKYLTFVDSDDQLKPDAYKTLITSLRSNKADVAIGAIERFTSKVSWTPSWVKTVHDVDRLGISGIDYPQISWDVFAWNKVYLTKTWKEVVGEFPVGKLYEDQEGTAKLFVNPAVKLNILAECTYRWRMREDGSSITQNKSSVDDLKQRLEIVEKVSSVISEASLEYRKYWYSKLLFDDLFWYLREIPRAEDEFWEVLSSSCRKYFEESPGLVLEGFVPERRLLSYIAAYGTREEFTKALIYTQEVQSAFKVRNDDGINSFYLPVMEEITSAIDSSLLRVFPNDFEAISGLLKQGFDESGNLFIEGYAFNRNLQPDFESRELRVFLVEDIDANLKELDDLLSSGIEIPSTKISSVQINSWVGDALNDYSSAGFRVVLDEQVISEIKDRFSDNENVPLALFVFFQDHGVIGTRYLSAKKIPNTVSHFCASKLYEDSRLIFNKGENDKLIVELQNPTFISDDLSLEVLDYETVLHGTIRFSKSVSARLKSRLLSMPCPILKLRSKNYSKEVVLKAAEDDCYSVFVKLDDDKHLLEGTWEDIAIELNFEDCFKSKIALVNAANVDVVPDKYSLVSDQHGNAEIRFAVQSASVDEIFLDSNSQELVFEGFYYFDDSVVRTTCPTFALVGKNYNLTPSKSFIDSTKNRYKVSFSMNMPGFREEAVALIESGFSLQILTPTGKKIRPSVWPKCSIELEQQMPLDIRGNDRRVVIGTTAQAWGISVSFVAAFNEDESGKYAQAKLQEIFNDSERAVWSNCVLMECFGGKTVTDSVLELDRYLAQNRPEITRYWTVKDYSISVPEGATPLLMYSRKWYEALAHCQFLVNNNNFPFYFRKHPKQTYIQVWHGTPLKRIGNDVPSANLSLSYKALIKREAEQYWDYMIAQSPWAGEVIANAFSFKGEMLVEGYPRNDRLVSSVEKLTSENKRIRAKMGIPMSAKIVLYAPTWRDDIKSADGKYVQPVLFDINSASTQLGDSYVFLVRGHANTAHQNTIQSTKNVIDVTKYPDINELFLIADLLITDYSSVMFDFVNTYKPILFMVPDLEHYRDELRGFYFDFENEAPGPLLKSTDDIVKSIKKIGVVFQNYRMKYDLFVNKYAPRDDGYAAHRIGDLVFGK
ncbi:hypothetical protein BSR29_00515 [Boudabousia liubingyangii]|uniref:Glycosyltransferase 2-like domain-containing protein n=1 Tax=Boudabousia liubingyangii TaxID=1921764 RepID=A0A1Q5PPV2_9ACTO|nr:CDP-glycerol glycerophosphotransferase family protein [Boudabousia liubingyangii]OKL49480.1 hypothetical protein BSR29_00515 [Boudabousia liubingyangii]